MRAGTLFPFVQLELPWLLGPVDGRHAIRRLAGEEVEHVLVVATLGAAPRRSRLRGRHGHPVEPGREPATVRTTRATLIDARSPFAGEAEAQAWLADAGETEVEDAVRRLDRVLYAHRIASADPYVREVSREQALAARVGYGTGEEVADGRWSEARELPPPPEGGIAGRRGMSRRAAALRPQERLAALLSARDVALACEELALRARLDLDQDRPREAALQLRVALEAALAELEAWRGTADLGERVDELAGRRAAVAAAANAALRGALAESEAASVADVLGRLEAALRARVVHGLD